MKQFKFYLMAAFAAAVTCAGFTSCDNDDEESTVNPAETKVAATKQHDTAILLCTFGSTYNESLSVYDDIMKDFQTQFGSQADIYLSFTSRTCIGRAEASTGEARYKLGDWLDAIGNAGYKRVAIQSLHVIPGEEYLSLMNTDVKKNFMIEDFPQIDVLRGANLLSDQDDTEQVANILYNHYKSAGVLTQEKNIVLLMGHGNPDENYNANQKYIDVENALHDIDGADFDNIFVGTVDYGDMLFWPKEEEELKEGQKDTDVYITDAATVRAQYKSCIYSKIMDYCDEHGFQPSDVTVYLAPFMSIAGDHAHNDLWGLEALAEGDPDADEVRLYTNEYSWRERLTKIGFNISDFESHPVGQAGADHGIKDGCGMKALGSYPEIRTIWVNHLKTLWDEGAWENGMDYQPDAE